MASSELPNHDQPLKHAAGSKLLTFASLIALGLSLWLSVQTLSGANLPGCGGAGSCESVLHTRWGQWFGVPVSLVASVLYALTTVLSFSALSSEGSGRERRWLLDAHAVLAALILVAGVWFVYLQVLQLNAICKFCMLIQGVGGLVAVLLLRRATRYRQQESVHPRTYSRPVLVTLALLGIFLAGQLLGDPPETHALSAFRFGGGSIRISKVAAPIYGNPEAEFVFLELFDYTCESCRELAPMLKEARQRYGPQFAVVLVPCPLERKCNPYTQSRPMAHANACEYARIALTVWLASPQQFEDFHEWLFFNHPLPTIDATRGRAENLVGADLVKRFEKDERIDQLIALGTDLYRQQQQPTMPKLMAEEQQISGVPRSSAALFEALEQISRIRQPPEVQEPPSE